MKILTTRILFKRSRKNSFFDEISISKTTIKDDSSKNDIIEIHSIAIASFNILSRQKNVEMFAVCMKNLKIQLKKQKTIRLLI
jgi:hypothetical protein